jgi:hypothetical protein
MNIESIVNLLFTEFVKKYGNIIEKDVVREFINRLDDLRELSEKYVDYLFDYVMDFNLWA